MNAKWHVLSIVFCLLYACDGWTAEQGNTQANELPRLAEKVKAVAELEGTDYLAKRNELTDEAQKNKELFVTLRKSSQDWQVVLICDILLERVENHSEIEKLKDTLPQIPWKRGYDERVTQHANALVRQFSGIPVFLVEALWKGNEAKLWHDGNERYYLVRALGMLKVKAARHPIESLLDQKDNDRLHKEAFRALGMIGDPASVPILLQILERDPERKDYGTVGAEDAIDECASEDQVPMLLQLFRTTQNPRIQDATRSAIEKLKGIPYLFQQAYPERYGYIDSDGRMVIAPKPWRTYGFFEGLAAFTPGDKWGFIDLNGKTVVEPKYDEVRQFSEGLAPVRVNKRWGYINKNGKEVIEPRFVAVETFHDGIATAAILPPGADVAKWGYIDTKGAFVIEPQFDDARGFSEGRAAVMLDNRWGFIDRTGKTVVKPQFHDVGKFSNGRAYVQTAEEVFPVFPNQKSSGKDGD